MEFLGLMFMLTVPSLWAVREVKGSSVSVSNHDNCNMSMSEPEGYRNCSRDVCRPEDVYIWPRFVRSSCFCDVLCDVYDDCCVENLHKESPFMNSGKGGQVVPSLSRGVVQCFPVPSIVSVGIPILVVSKCPTPDTEQTGHKTDQQSDQAVQENCESEDEKDLFLNWPVTDGAGILYKNIYCGLCNGRQLEELIYWVNNIDCKIDTDPTPGAHTNNTQHDKAQEASGQDGQDGQDGQGNQEEFYRLVQEKLSDGSCSVHYTFPRDVLPGGGGYRPCKPNISRCPPGTDPCLARLCQEEGTSYVYSSLDYTIYRNRYCAVCNNVTMTSCTDVISDSLSPGLVLGISPFYPLSIILDLNSGRGHVMHGHVGHTSHRTEIRHCPQGHVHDPYLSRCRAITCRAGYRLINDTCQGVTGEDCIVKVLNPGEYTFLASGDQEEGGIWDNTTGMEVPAEQYEVLSNGSLLLCTNLSREYTDPSLVQLKFSRAQTLLSVLGQSASLLCLGVHFSVYMIFPQLRNLAGRNLLSLVASLFIAQLTFLLGVGQTGSHMVCVIIATVIHYSFLASFSWMHVMGYDIWRTFASGSTPASMEDGRRAFRKYSLYGWGAPWLVVVVTLICNYFMKADNTYRPVLGEHICWFGHRRALFIFFAAPVALIVGSNLVFFLLTVRNLQRISRETQLVMSRGSGSQGDRRRVGLYAKLSALMGLTWLSGFLAAGTDWEPAWYLFILLGTMQGVFICVSFVFTRQVYKLVREKFYKPETSTATTPKSRSSGMMTSSTHVTSSLTDSNNQC